MICTINKGSHYCSGYSLGSLHTGTTKMQFDVKFERSCLELPGRSDCDGDWNKLFGWSYGMHHTNSIRMVWKSQSGMIRIGWYLYEGGKVSYKGFANVNVETFVAMRIDHNAAAKEIVFNCGGKLAVVAYSKSPSSGYTLKPYFGGNCTAPVTMKITLI